ISNCVVCGVLIASLSQSQDSLIAKVQREVVVARLQLPPALLLGLLREGFRRSRRAFSNELVGEPELVPVHLPASIDTQLSPPALLAHWTSVAQPEFFAGKHKKTLSLSRTLRCAWIERSRSTRGRPRWILWTAHSDHARAET